MTRLLVSVRNAPEAAEALAAGAHLIDVKEPERGALGAADLATIGEVIRVVNGRVPVSAALGELVDSQSTAVISPAQLPPGLSFAKIGLANTRELKNWPDLWRQHMVNSLAGVQPVAVAYADWELAGAPHPTAVFEAAVRFQCAALLIDTYDKSHGGLFDFVDIALLRQLIAAARSANILSVLAGSLAVETLPRAISIAPDFVAVRGAACAGNRTGRICSGRVQRLVELLKNAENTGVSSGLTTRRGIANSVA